MNLGRYTVSAALLSALLTLPCVCSAAESYEEPAQWCHDLAESAYQIAVARGDGLPDAVYEQAQSLCESEAYRYWLIATPSVSLSALLAFDCENDITACN